MKKKDKKKLDSLVKQITLHRDGNICCVCGEKLTKTGKARQLQLSHFYSKSVKNHQNMRFNPLNTCIMCGTCHNWWWHKDIICASEWYNANIDEDRRMELAVEAMKPSVLPFGGDYEKIKEYLINYFKTLQEDCQSL